jgi:hypothetical protein
MGTVTFNVDANGNGVYDSHGANIIINQGVFAGLDHTNSGNNVPNPPADTIDESHVPSVATISFAGGNLTFLTKGGKFIMGQNQKVTVSGGNLDIDTTNSTGTLTVGGDAYLGDLVAVGLPGTGNITVSTATGQIYLLKREAAPIELFDGAGSILDTGLHFTATGAIKFLDNGKPVIELGNSPEPIAEAGDPVDSDLGGVPLKLLPPGAPISLSNPVVGSVFGTGVQVVGAADFDGVTPDDVLNSTLGEAESLVEGIFGVTSSPIGTNSGQGNAASAFGFLGIVPRDATFDEQFSSALYGHTVYDDSPKTIEASDSDMRVAIPRVPADEAQLGKELSRELFYTPALDAAGHPIVDPATGQPKLMDRSVEIRQTLGAAYDEYRTLYPTRETSFFDFLRETSRYQTALSYAELVRSLNDLIGRLGLSSHEEAAARRKLFLAVTPSNVSTAEFLKAF